MRSVGRLKGINFTLALAAAGLALAAAPVLAGQRPSEGAPSHGTAVDRPSGGGGGGGGAAAASTPSTTLRPRPRAAAPPRPLPLLARRPHRR